MASSAAPPLSLEHAAAPPSAVVKLSLRGETFRFTILETDLSWKTMEATVHDCYDDAHRPPLWTLVYRDDEGDLVTVSTEREFQEAVRVFQELKGQPTIAQKLCLHFHVVAKLSLKQQLAPVLHVVSEITEKMARLAVETRDSLRKSAYVERGRESLYHGAAHTRDALSSAGRGLSQRVRRASTVVVEEIAELPRRLRSRSRVSSQDLRDDDASPQVLMATDIEHTSPVASEELDVAQLLAQVRAEEAAAERRALEPDTAADETDNTSESSGVTVPSEEDVTVEPIDTEADDDHVAVDEAHGSDAETASTASEDQHDWDFVRTPSPTRPLSPFFEVEGDDQVEVSFSRWETQLRTIRDIMPQLDFELCVDVLDKHNGNLEEALVELIEM